MRINEITAAPRLFYARPEIARRFANWIKGQDFYPDVTRVIDPAAGARALSKHFENVIEFDLQPLASSTIQANFFNANIPYQEGTLVIMNPPPNDVVKFFDKAASVGDYIAQIIPYGTRYSVPPFTKVDEWKLPKDAFLAAVEGETRLYNMPAVAQLWVRSA